MHEFSRVDTNAQLHGGSSSFNNGKMVPPFQTKNATRLRGASRAHENGIKGTPTVTVAYFNYMDRDLVVTTRDGTAVVVPPVGGYSSDEFLVCVTHAMTRQAMERALDTLRSKPNQDDREVVCWIRAYEGALYNNSHHMLSASIEYLIYHRDMCDAAGRCYMPDCDLLVEWLADHGSIHPFDKSKRDEATLRELAPGAGDNTFVFMIKAVDNAVQVQRSTRYVNYGGDIFMIPIERDLRYQTGVHVVTRSPVKDGQHVSDIISKTYTYEEADKKFGLHRSVEDAEIGGPMNDMAKMIIDRDTTVRRVEEAKIRSEQLGADITVQRLKNEGAITKALQEKDSFDRRNYVEWAKSAAALLGAAVTIYGILSSVTSK
ncbi:hypothetical protein D3C85_16140 [compost metagenome]